MRDKLRGISEVIFCIESEFEVEIHPSPQVFLDILNQKNENEGSRVYLSDS